jgi:hypothetical protein
MSELKNVAPHDFIEGGFGGSYRRRHREIMVMVLRFRVLFEIVRIGFYMVGIAGLITC